MTLWLSLASVVGSRTGCSLDGRAFFDSVPHDLLFKAVAHHTDERWVLLYIERWLIAPMQMPDRTLVARPRGTPQGSPISPLLANLFMHYAFDRWLHAARQPLVATFEAVHQRLRVQPGAVVAEVLEPLRLEGDAIGLTVDHEGLDDAVLTNLMEATLEAVLLAFAPGDNEALIHQDANHQAA
jgi:hypothetical protein